MNAAPRRRAVPAPDRRVAVAVALGLLLSGAAGAESGAIPQVGERGAAAYQAYRFAVPHKAFAIASGGAWAWVEEQSSTAQARSEALARCRRSTPQQCLVYALDDRIVLDHGRWIASWGPYATAEQARLRPQGLVPGERFPNLRFRDARGATKTIADFSGTVRLVHFWGSWCPPCLRELPLLRRLNSELRGAAGEDFTLLMLQVREPLEQSLRWLADNDLTDLPVYDSATSAQRQWRFETDDGAPLPDRELARAFPTSYVLDRNGVIVFRHIGPIGRWEEYRPFFRHLIAH